MVYVDDESNLAALQELNRIAFVTNFTLFCAWSNIECARYLETLKSYENKPATSIQAKEETEFLPRLTKVLTSVRSVNKTDVATLLDVFGNFGNICNAQEQQLVLCPGLGEKKVKRLYAAFHEPFAPSKKTRVTNSMFDKFKGETSKNSNNEKLEQQDLEVESNHDRPKEDTIDI